MTSLPSRLAHVWTLVWEFLVDNVHNDKTGAIFESRSREGKQTINKMWSYYQYFNTCGICYKKSTLIWNSSDTEYTPLFYSDQSVRLSVLWVSYSDQYVRLSIYLLDFMCPPSEKQRLEYVQRPRNIEVE